MRDSRLVLATAAECGVVPELVLLLLLHLLDLLHLLFYRLLLCRHYRVLLRLDIALSLRRLAVHKHRDGGLAHFLNTVTLHVGLVDRRR